MKKPPLSMKAGGTMPRPALMTKNSAGFAAVKIVIFFVSLAIISVCLFVFTESYPRRKPSPQYEKAATEMRESLHNAVARIGQTERPHELKLKVINGEYRAVKR